MFKRRRILEIVTSYFMLCLTVRVVTLRDRLIYMQVTYGEAKKFRNKEKAENKNLVNSWDSQHKISGLLGNCKKLSK